MAIIAEHYLTDLERKFEPMPHHKAGLMYTATGYGRKIPTTRMVKLPGSPRWRRVYCAIYGNAGTCYVTSGKDWIVIN
jgi:hypothetical protein